MCSIAPWGSRASRMRQLFCPALRCPACGSRTLSIACRMCSARTQPVTARPLLRFDSAPYRFAISSTCRCRSDGSFLSTSRSFRGIKSLIFAPLYSSVGILPCLTIQLGIASFPHHCAQLPQWPLALPVKFGRHPDCRFWPETIEQETEHDLVAGRSSYFPGIESERLHVARVSSVS